MSREMDELSSSPHRNEGEKTKEKSKENRQPKVSDYVVHIPKEIYQKQSKQTFAVGRFLGKGSYAKCFEVTNTKNGNKFACKILSKNILYDEKLRKCVRTEVDIHSHVAHDNITQYISEFCDDHNLYMVLELCPFRSLKELQETRCTITEIECRVFIHEILCGVRYLHQLKIVHRDLKLSNVFLSHNMRVKIGDFGLAARITGRDSLLYSTCGTANYFAPEIVKKIGYSYEVDVWCVGVMMYFLLVGKAPFDGETIDDLFDKIEDCDYHIPTGLSSEATQMISEILQENRYRRPTADQCLQNDFIRNFIMPKSLPIYCLLREPRPEDIPMDDDEFFESFFKPGDQVRLEFNSMFGPCQDRNINDMDNLCQYLSNVTARKRIRYCQLDEIVATQNALPSKIWVKMWMYDRATGSAFAYQLNDDAIGIIFEDNTKFIKASEMKHIDYIDARGQTERVTTAHHPTIVDFKAKMQLFLKYNSHMRENLKDMNHYKCNQSNNQLRPTTVHSWFTTAESIVMYLTNGIVQINFLDHIKLILDSRDATVTIICPKQEPKTLSFEMIESIAMPPNIHSRLKFAMVKTKYLMGHLKKSRRIRQKLI